MPRRTNPFQEFVAIVQRHVWTEATVEESVELTDRVSRKKREVDAVVRLTTPTGTLSVSFEVNKRKRPATIEWVEQLIKKHERLPTNQLVLVSNAGFTKNGAALAEGAGVLTWTPETLSDPKAEYRVVTKIEAVWPKIVAFTPRQVGFGVERPDGETQWFVAAHDQLLVYEDGRDAANPIHLIQRLFELHFNEITAQLDANGLAEDIDGEFRFTVDEPGEEVTPAGIPLFVRWESDEDDASRELHRITKMAVAGHFMIHVGEAKLTHARLGETDAAYGETTLGGRKALVVVTEGPDGPKTTLRIGPATPGMD